MDCAEWLIVGASLLVLVGLFVYLNVRTNTTKNTIFASLLFIIAPIVLTSTFSLLAIAVHGAMGNNLIGAISFMSILILGIAAVFILTAIWWCYFCKSYKGRDYDFFTRLKSQNTKLIFIYSFGSLVLASALLPFIRAIFDISEIYISFIIIPFLALSGAMSAAKFFVFDKE